MSNRPPLSFLTKRELIQTLDLINSSSEIATETELKDILVRVREIVPCEHIIAGLGQADHSGSFQGFVKLVNVSYPLGWVTAYVDQRYGEVDPILRTHFKGFRTQKWTGTFQKVRSRREKEFIDSARSFGLSEGITLGICSPEKKSWSVFSFSGLSIEEHKRHEYLLESLMPHFHQALLRIVSPSPISSYNVSPREREVLNWMKEGKSTRDISEILQISERTVYFHVQNIFLKFRASSRCHAVAIALQEKIIGH